MVMHTDDADIRYSDFQDLGRTDKRIPTDQSLADMSYEEIRDSWPLDR
jgi:hypothetical protein